MIVQSRIYLSEKSKYSQLPYNSAGTIIVFEEIRRPARAYQDGTIIGFPDSVTTSERFSSAEHESVVEAAFAARSTGWPYADVSGVGTVYS